MNRKDDKFGPENVIFNFMQVDRLHHACIDAKVSAQGFGIHRNQHAFLMFLDKEGENISQKDIAEKFGISAAAVANALKTLESGGYIEREADPEDTRRNIVRITDKGRNVISRSAEIFDSVDAAMISNLSENDLKIFRKCLDTMADNLKREIGEREDNR